MPNIEIHGTSPRFGGTLADVAVAEFRQQVKKKIWAALASAAYVDEIVITTVESQTEDRSGQSQPFLRLVAPAESALKLEDIRQRLAPLNMDIEIMTLAVFIPKQVERPHPSDHAGGDDDLEYDRKRGPNPIMPRSVLLP